MLVHNSGFIGHDTNQSVNFTGSDSEELFLSNLNSQPQDWYYRHKSVEYQYNSLGHRCKNIEDIDLSNYILFTGCSHTEGVGIELEKTYPHQLAAMLGCDYYNLALGGTGIDIMTHNLTMWSKKISSSPKAVVILWPDIFRFMTLEDNSIIHTHSISNKNTRTTNFLIAGDEVGFFEARKNLSKILIDNLFIDCPIIYNNFLSEKDVSLFPRLDLARDMSHYGIESNRIFAVELAKLLR